VKFQTERNWADRGNKARVAGDSEDRRNHSKMAGIGRIFAKQDRIIGTGPAEEFEEARESNDSAPLLRSNDSATKTVARLDVAQIEYLVSENRDQKVGLLIMGKSNQVWIRFVFRLSGANFYQISRSFSLAFPTK
jgi:hypothetical protein